MQTKVKQYRPMRLVIRMVDERISYNTVLLSLLYG